MKSDMNLKSDIDSEKSDMKSDMNLKSDIDSVPQNGFCLIQSLCATEWVLFDSVPGFLRVPGFFEKKMGADFFSISFGAEIAPEAKVTRVARCEMTMRSVVINPAPLTGASGPPPRAQH